MKTLFTLLLLLPIAFALEAQQTEGEPSAADSLVNLQYKQALVTTFMSRDGISPVTIVKNGNITTIIKADGKVSTAIQNGNTTTIVNPDGSHSTLVINGNVSTFITSKGTSTIINNGATSLMINPDGSHTVLINPG